MRVVVVGGGAGGLACAARLRELGHEATVLEAEAAPGGKCARVERGGFAWDAGPSLLTMPWVVRAAVGDDVELMRVEPVTRYRFADGTAFDMSADLPRAVEALEAWSPGAGADWTRFLGVCAGMWRASLPFLTGPPPWPPRRPAPGEPPPDPRDLLRVRPWHTLRTLARGLVRDPRLRMVVERFATYAGGDPRSTPAALAVAGYVEHAFGAWHVRGGLHEIVRALARRAGDVRCGVRVEGLAVEGERVRGVATPGGFVAADAVVWNGDELALDRLLGRRRDRPAPSLSGLALMLGLRGARPGAVHHEIRFPASYDAEFDDVFRHRRMPRDPTLYLSSPGVTEGAAGDAESLFVLVNAPAGARPGEEHSADVVERLGLGGRVVERVSRGPAELERATGAVGGAIYGAAPHGRLGALRRPGQRVRGVSNLFRVGGTVHPGGGLPLVMLGGRSVAGQIAAAA